MQNLGSNPNSNCNTMTDTVMMIGFRYWMNFLLMAIFMMFDFPINRDIAIYCSKKILTAWAALQGCFLEERMEDFPVPVPNRRVNTVTHAYTLNRTPDDARILQRFEVLRGRGLCQAKFIYQIAADTGILLDEVLQDGNTCRVSQCLGHIGKVILLFGEQCGFRSSHFNRNITIYIPEFQIPFFWVRLPT